MLKIIRFTLIPIEVNYHSCPFQRPPLPTVDMETVAVVCDDMKRGLIKAYRTLTADYNDPQTDFKEVPYISPRLGYVMESVREDPPLVVGAVQEVSLLHRSFSYGYTEAQDKIGGFYSREEVIEQLIAGFCGPESPMWHYIPQRERMEVLYTTNERVDLLQFERDVDKDGDWVLSDINGMVSDV